MSGTLVRTIHPVYNVLNGAVQYFTVYSLLNINTKGHGKMAACLKRLE